MAIIKNFNKALENIEGNPPENDGSSDSDEMSDDGDK
jgi:hypothetical protein